MNVADIRSKNIVCCSNYLISGPITVVYFQGIKRDLVRVVKKKRQDDGFLLHHYNAPSHSSSVRFLAFPNLEIRVARQKV